MQWETRAFGWEEKRKEETEKSSIGSQKMTEWLGKKYLIPHLNNIPFVCSFVGAQFPVCRHF